MLSELNSWIQYNCVLKLRLKTRYFPKARTNIGRRQLLKSTRKRHEGTAKNSGAKVQPVAIFRDRLGFKYSNLGVATDGVPEGDRLSIRILAPKLANKHYKFQYGGGFFSLPMKNKPWSWSWVTVWSSIDISVKPLSCAAWQAKSDIQQSFFCVGWVVTCTIKSVSFTKMKGKDCFFKPFATPATNKNHESATTINFKVTNEE